jgi:hypothetical protein
MKFLQRNLILSFMIAVMLSGYCSQVATAQEPPHPPNSGHGMGGNHSPGGNAQLTDGIGILIAFAIAYSYRRYTISRKAGKEEEPRIE